MAEVSSGVSGEWVHRVRPARSGFGTAGLSVLAVGAIGMAALVPMEHSLWIALAVFLAALVSSVAGFAFSAICGAMLFHLTADPVQAVRIMMICSIGGQSLMVWALRREIPWRTLLVFLAGAAVGLPLGIFVLLHLRNGLYDQAIGTFLVIYAVVMMARRPMIVRRQSALADFLVGVLGGVTGGAAAFPGAFVTIWCGFKGWSKEQQRALYQPFILIVQCAALAAMALPGVAPRGQPALDFSGVAFVPAVLLGAIFGMACFRRLSDRQFSLAVNLLLVVSGLSFLL